MANNAKDNFVRSFIILSKKENKKKDLTDAFELLSTKQKKDAVIELFVLSGIDIDNRIDLNFLTEISGGELYWTKSAGTGVV